MATSATPTPKKPVLATNPVTNASTSTPRFRSPQSSAEELTEEVIVQARSASGSTKHDHFLHRQFFDQGDNKYGVFPGNWDRKRYGPPPMLGIVYADNEFLAAKLAYDRGIFPVQSVAPDIRFFGQAKRP